MAEVAGLVLAVLPLITTAMKCFENAQSLRRKIRSKNKLFRDLRRSVTQYDAVVNENLDWLLSYAGVDQPRDGLRRSALLQKPEVAQKIREFLGERSAEAFNTATSEIEEALEPLLRKIDGFLIAQPKGGNSLLQNVRFKSEDEVQLRYRDGFKLALSSQEIEQSKAKADHATNIIQSLLIAKSNAQAIKIGNQVKSRTRNTTRSLTRIRAFANQLHQAIATCWTNGCHSDHEFNLHLEDRIDSTQAVKSSVRFDTIFVSKGSRNSQNRVQISRASLIEVFCNDNDGQDALTNSGGLRSSNVHVPRLVIPQEEPRLQVLHSRKIADMCLEVCRMYHATETLKLYVHPSCTIHQSHSASTQHPPAAHSDAVTLKELLSQNLRLFPRRCTELALILASALLQFSETPWCATYWTKDGVYFTKKDPSIPTQNLQMGDVDITRPLTVKAFQRLPSSNNQDVSKPTKATLELGILMLEIWHGISLEDRFHDRPNQLKGDDLDRKQLADRWLREDDHLNFQQDAVQTCLDCFNIYGAKGDITWEDEDFLHSFVEGVIEPLYKASNKSRS